MVIKKKNQVLWGLQTRDLFQTTYHVRSSVQKGLGTYILVLSVNFQQKNIIVFNKIVDEIVRIQSFIYIVYKYNWCFLFNPIRKDVNFET